MESKKETSVKGQSAETVCFLLFTTGHILQQPQWEGIDPNPISPAFFPSFSLRSCERVSTEEPKICLTQSQQEKLACIYDYLLCTAGGVCMCVFACALDSLSFSYCCLKSAN